VKNVLRLPSDEFTDAARLFVKYGFLSPVFVDVVTVSAYPQAAPAQADRFDTEIAAAGSWIFAHALQTQLVFTGLGPEVQQVILPHHHRSLKN